ncbi:MAG: hypothetical protein L3J52_06390, partial [Proteobacteria bacterium]|nr:hypothetical protein [Pseudomonadota bacterium]
MKKNKIISTAGLNLRDANRLRSYCQLMQGALIDKWLFADEYIDCHVCFIMSDYLNKMNPSTYARAQLVVTVLSSDDSVPAMGHYISLPMTADKIRTLLNQISSQWAFTSKKLTHDKTKTNTREKPSNRIGPILKTLWQSLRENRKAKSVKREKQKRLQFLTKLNNKINPDTKRVYRVVLLGSPGSGKTTAIQSASQNSALTTEVTATDSVAAIKASTTIGIDYAQITLSGGRSLQLIGT